MCAVIAIHTFGYNAVAEGARGTALGRFAVIVDAAAVVSVPLFVMMSGTLLLDPRRYGDTGSYLRRRLRRLIPALVFWQAFYWIFRITVRGEEVDASTYGTWILKGTSYQALYYFWIIIGLVLVGSLLIPWIAQVSHRAVLVAGLGFCAMPVLTMLTHTTRGLANVWIETPWTWWVFYLGLFLLGWALATVVVRGVALAGLTIVVAALACVQIYVFRNADLDAAWVYLTGGSVYTLGTHLYAIVVFVWLHSLFAPGGPLVRLTTGRLGALGVITGASTLGVFAFHSAVTWILADSGVLGDDLVADSAPQLVARYAIAVVVSFGVIVLARRWRPLTYIT